MWREARSRADVLARNGLHVSCQAVCFSILELRILISRIFRIFKIFGLEIETKTGRRNRDKNLSRKMRLVWARHNKASVRAQCWSRFPRPVLVSIPDPKNYKNRETWLPHFTIFLIFWIGNCVQTWRGNRDENWSRIAGLSQARHDAPSFLNQAAPRALRTALGSTSNPTATHNCEIIDLNLQTNVASAWLPL